MSGRQELTIYGGLRVIIKLLTMVLYNQLHGEPAPVTRERQLQRLREAESFAEDL